MWFFWPITILLLYFFAVLQSSFFTHFVFFGAVLNLVFILFFILVFFNGRRKFGYSELILSFFAGFLLDIFSETRFGVSIVLLILISFFIKKTRENLNEQDDPFPLSYFIALFLTSFLLFKVLISVYLHFFDPIHLRFSVDFKLLAEIIYNLAFATVGFFIYKKFKGNGKKL